MARKTMGRRRSSRRGRERAAPKRSRYLENVDRIDSTDYDFLRKFQTDHGKVIPARITGATAKQQRQIKAAVRRARNIGLLP